jgi:hypothetical protein
MLSGDRVRKIKDDAVQCRILLHELVDKTAARAADVNSHLHGLDIEKLSRFLAYTCRHSSHHLAEHSGFGGRVGKVLKMVTSECRNRLWPAASDGLGQISPRQLSEGSGHR